ncbi:MAG: PIN domain-containing protein [Pseudomonadales bacterium]|jgi:predicted nucleic acid-binding protein|nr:PIN domain-containing protein [Pseudomonadales bacterium]
MKRSDNTAKERCFLDTNILLYTDDGAAPAKQTQALHLLEDGWNSGTLVLSTQVLQEYTVAASRKLGVPIATVQRKVELFHALEILSIEHRDIVRAIELHRLYQFSFWDSLIIRMAQKASCAVLLSEDLQHGQTIGDLRIVNPFRV